MRKAGFLLALLAAAPLAADEHPSNLSLALETGAAWGSLPGNSLGRMYGGDIRYDVLPRWSVLARFQSRAYKLKSNPSQQTVIQPVTAGVVYDLRTPGDWTPYAFLEAGLSHNRRTVGAVVRVDEKPCVGLGLGAELNFLTLNALSLEVAHRRFAGASPGAHQVTETGLALALRFAIPDDWIPIKPDKPLKIPDMDDPDAKPSAPPLPDVEKRQAQMELDKVQQDIRDRKAPPIQFEEGQALLLDASRETLDVVGTLLRRYPDFPVVVTAHTDEAGSDEENLTLSQARAEVVRTYLVQNFGLPADKLTARGAGASQPGGDANADEGRLLNRRVEFTVQP